MAAMKILYFTLLFLAFSLYSQAEGEKEAIAQQKKKIEAASGNEKAALTEKLALLYLKDQDQEGAFEALLKSLENPPQSLKIDADPAYDEALLIYLQEKPETATETSRKIIMTYAPVLKERKAPSQLGFLLAIAYANVHLYQEFIPLFYSTYRAFPTHFLAYKTKGMLHLKLMERKRAEGDRLQQRAAAIADFEAALALNPSDVSLYRLIIIFQTPELKRNQVQRFLNKMINDNIIIPRSEVMFYVREAVDVKEFDLAQRFITKAHQWHGDSRILDGAQNYLDKQKNASGGS